MSSNNALQPMPLRVTAELGRYDRSAFLFTLIARPRPPAGFSFLGWPSFRPVMLNHHSLTDSLQVPFDGLHQVARLPEVVLVKICVRWLD